MAPASPAATPETTAKTRKSCKEEEKSGSARDLEMNIYSYILAKSIPGEKNRC